MQPELLHCHVNAAQAHRNDDLETVDTVIRFLNDALTRTLDITAARPNSIRTSAIL